MDRSRLGVGIPRYGIVENALATEIQFMSSAEWDAIRLSLQVAAASAACSLPFALVVAWILARCQFFGKSLFETIINLPLVLPPVVTGFLLLVLFGRNGPLGRTLENWFGVRFVFDWKGAALAAAIVSFPLMVRAIKVALNSVDTRLEETARTLGAGPLDAFLTITMPLAWHGIIGGCLLAFARSLGEFGATIMLAGNTPGKTQTIPLYVYDQFQSPTGMAGAWVLVIMSVFIAFVALAIGERLERRVVPGGSRRRQR